MNAPAIPNRKLAHARRTFRSMVIGWLACNFYLTLLLWWKFPDVSEPSQFSWFLWLYAATGVVIVAAWLFIFLPADKLVPPASPLRKPLSAAACGAAGGLLPFSLPVIVAGVSQGTPATEIWRDLVQIWPLIAGAMITGTVASFHLVLRHPRLKAAPSP